MDQKTTAKHHRVVVFLGLGNTVHGPLTVLGMGNSVTGPLDENCRMWQTLNCEAIANGKHTKFLNCPIVDMEKNMEYLKSIPKIIAEAAKDAYAVHYVINITKGQPAAPSYPSIAEMKAAGMLIGVCGVTESIGLVMHPEACDIRDKVIEYFADISGVPVQHVDLIYNENIPNFDCWLETIVAAAKWSPSVH